MSKRNHSGRPWLKPVNLDHRDAEYLRVLIETDIARLKGSGEEKLIQQAYRTRQAILGVLPPSKNAHYAAIRRRNEGEKKGQQHA